MIECLTGKDNLGVVLETVTAEKGTIQDGTEKDITNCENLSSAREAQSSRAVCARPVTARDGWTTLTPTPSPKLASPRVTRAPSPLLAGDASWLESVCHYFTCLSLKKYCH